MRVEVSEETAEILFRVLTEEKKENYELKRLKECVDELVERNEYLENIQKFGDEEWRKEMMEASRLIKVHAGQFFTKDNPPESYTFSGKLLHLINTLKGLAEHEKIDRRCQGIVLALTAIDPKTKFTVLCRGDEKFVGAIVKVRDGVLHLRTRNRSIKKIDLKSVMEVVLAEEKGKKDGS